MAYHLEGRLLEVCNCRVLCPCWIGEDPDFGTCDTIVAWRFDKGSIEGIDVAGHTIALIAQLLILPSVTITGPGANLVTVRGGNERVLEITDTVTLSPVTVALSGMTITGGRSIISPARKGRDAATPRPLSGNC